MDSEIQLISDGDGLAVIGKPMPEIKHITQPSDSGHVNDPTPDSRHRVGEQVPAALHDRLQPSSAVRSALSRGYGDCAVRSRTPGRRSMSNTLAASSAASARGGPSPSSVAEPLPALGKSCHDQACRLGALI